MAQSKELYDAILNGDAKKAHAVTQTALAVGALPMDLISESMVPAMDEVGRLFEAEEYFVPELLLHDIGKNIVASMLEGSGFEVIDLGTDVSPEMFVAAVEERRPHIVCMSALLTVTMPAMKTTIDALKTAGVRTAVKVLIGGAPVTMQYAKEIGADGYSENASAAVGLVKNLLTVV